MELAQSIKARERALNLPSARPDKDDRFFVNMQRMEVERAKFVLKSYWRTRLAKIERHLIYIYEKDQAALLSEAEMTFVQSIWEARQTHFEESFLGQVPPQLNFMAKDEIPDQYSKSANVTRQLRYGTPSKWCSCA